MDVSEEIFEKSSGTGQFRGMNKTIIVFMNPIYFYSLPFKQFYQSFRFNLQFVNSKVRWERAL